MKVERSFFFAAVIVGGICLLPVDVFVLVSLWPQRVLVSWLLLGLAALVILVKLVLWVIKAGTIAKVRLSEEALRPGRLYAHERLVEDEGKRSREFANGTKRRQSSLDIRRTRARGDETKIGCTHGAGAQGIVRGRGVTATR